MWPFLARAIELSVVSVNVLLLVRGAVLSVDEGWLEAGGLGCPTGR